MIKASNPDDNRDRELKWLAYSRRKLVRQAKVLFLRHLMRHGASPIEVIHDDLEIPKGIDKRFLGVVIIDLARNNIIRRLNYANKRQPDSHGSPVGVWEISDYVVAINLLHLLSNQIKSE